MFPSSILLCPPAAHQLRGIALLLTRSLHARLQTLTSGAVKIFHQLLFGIFSSSIWPLLKCTAFPHFICVSLLHIQAAHVLSRPKPVVRLKQPAAAKSSSPAAALNAAWANFPMPTEFMAEEPGSFRMDWLSSADLGVSPHSCRIARHASRVSTWPTLSCPLASWACFQAAKGLMDLLSSVELA